MTEVEIGKVLSNCIVIIGAPRSGTSILARLLEAHPKVVHIKEPRVIWRYGNEGKSDMLKASDARPRVKAYIRKRFAKWVLKEGGEILVEKTPSNSLRVDFVKAVLPEAKIICITRNGFDSTLSIRDYWLNFRSGVSYDRIGSKSSVMQQRLKELSFRQIPYYLPEFLRRFLPLPARWKEVAWGPRIPGLMALKKELSVLEIAALQWRFCVESTNYSIDRLSENECYEIRFEELNESSLKDLLLFAGLDYHDRIKQYYNKNYNTGFVNRRASEADPDELELIGKWILPTMEWIKNRNLLKP